jgi:hypothetical protein
MTMAGAGAGAGVVVIVIFPVFFFSEIFYFFESHEKIWRGL